MGILIKSSLVCRELSNNLLPWVQGVQAQRVAHASFSQGDGSSRYGDIDHLLSRVQGVESTRVAHASFPQEDGSSRRGVVAQKPVKAGASLFQTMHQLNGFSQVNSPTKPSTYCLLCSLLVVVNNKLTVLWGS